MTILTITGVPGIGKTTTVIRAAGTLKDRRFTVGGIISRELRFNNSRVGFEFIDLIINFIDLIINDTNILASIVIPPRGLAYNPSAITDQDIYVWASHAVAPGELRGSFEYFRAFLIDAEQNKETAKSKITAPVLALGGDIYPALGGDYPGNFAYSSLQSLASNVTGIKTLYSWRTAKICNRSALNFSSNFLGTVLTTVKEHCHFSNRRF